MPKRPHYKVTGTKKLGFAVILDNGGIEYDLIETKAEAVTIRNLLNKGIGPDWDIITKHMEPELKD